MSYNSRVYRQRNANTHDEAQKEPFFARQHDVNRSHQKGAFFQAKLTVNKPGDSYEQEADSVANAVANKTTTGPVVQHKKISSIQRLATPVEDEKLGTNDARMAKDKEIQEKPIQRMDAAPEKEEPKGIQKMGEPEKEESNDIQKMDEPENKKEDIQKMGDPVKEEEDTKKTTTAQTKPEGTATTAPTHVASIIESSKGKGKALPLKTLKEMSARFGVDFSGVRIHDDSEAVGLARELQAQAFTHGRDIYFNEGRFDPESGAGKNLLAHELTHVVQQAGGK